MKARPVALLPRWDVTVNSTAASSAIRVLLACHEHVMGWGAYRLDNVTIELPVGIHLVGAAQNTADLTAIRLT